MLRKMKSDNIMKNIALLILIAIAIFLLVGIAAGVNDTNVTNATTNIANNITHNATIFGNNLSSNITRNVTNITNIANVSAPLVNVTGVNISALVNATINDTLNLSTLGINSTVQISDIALNASLANMSNDSYLALVDDRLYLIDGDIGRLLESDFVFKDRISIITLDLDRQNLTLDQLYSLSMMLNNLSGFSIVLQNTSVEGVVDVYMGLDDENITVSDKKSTGSIVPRNVTVMEINEATGYATLSSAYAEVNDNITDENNATAQSFSLTGTNGSRRNMTIDELIGKINMSVDSTNNLSSIFSIIALDITNLDNDTLDKLYSGKLTVEDLKNIFSYNVSSINMTTETTDETQNTVNTTSNINVSQIVNLESNAVNIQFSELIIDDPVPGQVIAAHQSINVQLENVTTNNIAINNIARSNITKYVYAFNLIKELAAHDYGTITWTNGLESYEIISDGAIISVNNDTQIEIESGKTYDLSVNYRFYPVEMKKECKAVTIGDLILPSDNLMITEGESMRMPAFRDCNITLSGESLRAMSLPLGLYSLGITESMTHTAYLIHGGILVQLEILNGSIVLTADNKTSVDLKVKTNYSSASVTESLHDLISIGMPVTWNIGYNVIRDGRILSERASYMTAPVYLTEQTLNIDNKWTKIIALDSSYAGTYDNILLEIRVPEFRQVALNPKLTYSVVDNSSGSYLVTTVPELTGNYKLTIIGSMNENANNTLVNNSVLNNTVISNITNVTANVTANITENITTLNETQINVTLTNASTTNVTDVITNITSIINISDNSSIIGLYKPVEEIISENNITLPNVIPTENITDQNYSAIVMTQNITVVQNNSRMTLIQEYAEIGKPVRWRQQVRINKSGKAEFNIPNESVNIHTNYDRVRNFSNITSTMKEARAKIRSERLLSLDNEQENSTVELTYETPAAQLRVDNVSEKSKTVTVYGPDSIHYYEVLSYTSLPTSLPIAAANKIRLYWDNNGTRQEHPFNVIDNNNDSIIDLVEWVTPHLSNETFEIIIITKADHLDSNRGFISDIYDLVKVQDNIWSETINDQEYVRVTFQKKLNNSNDITIYPRVVSGSPEIRVYEFNQSTEIARFSNIHSNELQKIFLTQLVGYQDEFDLQIVNGQVDFDLIVDPAIGACQNISIPGVYTLTASLNNVPNSCFNITIGNVTLDGQGFSIDGDDQGTDYGIYVFNGTNRGIGNITIRNFANITDFYMGVYTIRANSTFIWNLTVSSNNGYGIMVGMNSTKVDIKNITLFANNISGLYFSAANNSNVTNITSILNGRNGIYVNSTININMTIITADRNNYSGIYLNSSSNVNITIFTANQNNISGIYINASSNNTFYNGTVDGSLQSAILLVNLPTIGNNLKNLTIANTNDSYSDINFSTAGINGTIFFDTVTLENYSFAGNGGIVIVNKTGAGLIRFLSNISGSGRNFSSDIQLGYNLAYVNSTKGGLNVTANVTLYNIPVLPFPAIYRDNVTICNSTTTPACNNLTMLTAGTVTFNVTSWSNYTINDAGVTGCANLTISNHIYTVTGDILNYASGCFNITGSNITLDGNGFTLDGDDVGTDYGIYVFNGTTRSGNITIKNFANITDFYIGIYTLKTNQSFIWNLSANSNTGYGISLSMNSSLINVQNITVNSNGVAGLYLSGNANNSNFTNVTANLNSGDGIYINSSLSDNFTLVTVNSNNFSGIYLNSSSNINVTSFTANSNNISGIFMNASTNNTFYNGTIDGSIRNAILLVNLPNLGNVLNNISVTNTNVSYADINITTAGINGTRFIDMLNLDNYSFAGNGGIIIVNQTSYGMIRFLSNISGSGQHFNSDIRLANISAYVNSTKGGLNVTANITFYNLPAYPFPQIYRDSLSICNSSTTPACNNLTVLKNGGTAVFNVTSWSNYTIINAVNGCGNLTASNLVYTLLNDISNYNSTCFNITGSNITLDGNGFTIDGDDFSGTDYGIYIFNGTASTSNITVRNFLAITDFAIGIYASRTNYISIGNLSLTSNTRYGITILNSSYDDLENITSNSNAISGLLITSNFTNLTNITANVNGRDGIYINSSLNNTLITITANSNNYSGIYLNSSSYINITSFTTNLNNYSGLYINSSSNNTFYSGTINGSVKSAITLLSPINFITFGNIFNNISITGTSVSFADLNFTNAGINATQLIDIPNIYNYSFTGNGGIITVNKTGIGSVQFFRNVSGNGTNLSADIVIRNNFVYVNSTKRGLNVSANVTLYNVPAYPSPVIYRDGVNVCNSTTVPACTNFTPLDSGTVMFNVTSWSNYTINIGLTECDNLSLSNQVYTLQNSITDFAAGCFNITGNNITLDGNGFIIDGDDVGSDYGIYVYNGTSNITNVTIKNFAGITDFAIGIYMLNTNLSSVRNLTVNSNTQYGLSISFNSSLNDIDNITANANGISGLLLSSRSNFNNLTNITANANNRDGIYINSSFNNNLSIITTNLNNFSGIYLNASSYNNLSSITANLNNLSGIYLNASSNNTFYSGTINGSISSAILLVNLPTFGNILNNLSVTNTNASFADINISTAMINGTKLVDMLNLYNYSIAGDGGTIIVNETGVGAIQFFSNISGSGQNFSSDIQLSNNFVFVNSSKRGLNVSANVTLYSVPVYPSPAIYLDNVTICNSTTTPACYNFTTLDAGTVMFNITSWSNYTINTALTQCANLSVSNIVYTLQSSITNYASTCFNITGSNITLDGNGYSIDGDDIGSDYGIYVFNGTNNISNITIKNFANITDFSIGIYMSITNLSFVRNLTVNSNTQYGLSISFNSSFNDFDNITANANGISGIYLSSRSNSNNLTNITANSNSRDGIYINSSFNNNLSTINANLNNFSGIYLNASSYNNLSLITSNLNNISGIYLNSSSNNTFYSGTINGSIRNAILLVNLPTFGNIFNNISVTNTNDSFADLNISTAMINATRLIDMFTIKNYTFAGDGGTIIINESGVGWLQFWRNVSGNGQNLLSDIQIGNNFVFVNSSKAGLNVTANVTLYNISYRPFQVIYRDTTNICNSTTTPACTNFTVLNGTVAFNVTSWSNYSIGIALTRCTNITQSNFIYPLQNDITNFNMTCFNITGSNITLDGNGYTVDGDDFSTTDYGIYVFNGTSNITNVTVKNFMNVTDFAIGIYFSIANYSYIRNVTANSNIYGISLGFNSSYNALDNITVKSNSIAGILLSSRSNFNNLTNITSNANSRDGIYINSSFNNNLSIITSNQNNFSGIYLNSSSYNNVTSFTSNLNNISGIYLNASSNNTFYVGTINGSIRNAILLVNLPTFGNVFNNISITNTSVTYTDINISTASINGTQFLDMSALYNYSFTGNGSIITVNETGVGSIQFLSNVSGSGQNFSSDVQISSNYVYVNSSKRGLNVSANVTLYSVPVFAHPVIYRDGVFICNSTTTPSCYNFTPLNAGTIAFNVTSWSNYTVGDDPPDLIVNFMSFSNTTAIEGQNITVFVNFTNIGSDNSTNFTIQLNISFWNGTGFKINETRLSDSLNVSAGELKQINFTWLVKPGIFNFTAYVDDQNNMTEESETNNTYTITYTTSGWQILYGSYNYTFALADGSLNNMSLWVISIPDGNSYYSDTDSIFTPSNLRPLNDTNDFIEADIALNMTGFNDSVAKLFDADGNGKCDINTSFSISGVVVTNITIMNSTNSSAFITAIMWDSADGGSQYDGTQDLVFITRLNSSKVGRYGNYDYEVKLPSKLESLKGSVELVKRMDELI